MKEGGKGYMTTGEREYTKNHAKEGKNEGRKEGRNATAEKNAPAK